MARNGISPAPSSTSSNVFNDFIAAAEYMIDRGWTNPGCSLSRAVSNGLLVGATVNMCRPDLFKVAIPARRRDGHDAISSVHYRMELGP